MKELKKVKRARPEQGRRVLVAMSGGVDSSLTAALLSARGGSAFGGKERRYNACGVFLNLGQINYKQALEAAKKVAKKIDIPLKIIDLRKQFKKEVIDYFFETYSRGDTPNPCVICNKKIKFGLLFKLMGKWKFDYLATGHYVRLLKNKKWKLKIAADRTKDQSYFLYNLDQKQLAKLLFPLGNYTKEEVKKIADQRHLPYLKKESQEICFVHDADLAGFLKKRLHAKKGPIIELKTGKKIGEHNGVQFYTIGQRVPVGGTGPYYVADKNLNKNQLLVVQKNDKNFFRKEIKLKNVNWISSKPPKSAKILVRTRYRQPLVVAKITLHASRYMLHFNQPVKFVAPGQSAVFYNKESELLGGGVII